MIVKCVICDNGFETFDDRAKTCSDACRMKKYRMGECGKKRVAEYNLRYKRPNKEWECCRCKGKIISTRKRVLCEECIEWGKKMGYKNPSAVTTMSNWRKSNPLKVKAHSLSSALNKRIKRGTLKVSCLVCNNNKVEQHHHNYKKPKDTISLCKPHHNELHSWDSN